MAGGRVAPAAGEVAAGACAPGLGGWEAPASWPLQKDQNRGGLVPRGWRKIRWASALQTKALAGEWEFLCQGKSCTVSSVQGTEFSRVG
jgi:hypothetical protein